MNKPILSSIQLEGMRSMFSHYGKIGGKMRKEYWKRHPDEWKRHLAHMKARSMIAQRKLNRAREQYWLDHPDEWAEYQAMLPYATKGSRLLRKEMRAKIDQENRVKLGLDKGA